MTSRFPITQLIHNPVKPELVLANGDDFLVLNTSNGQVIKKLTGETEKNTIEDNYRANTFSQDGNFFVGTGETKAISVWNTNDWSPSTAATKTARKRVNAIQFNKDATVAIVADKFGDVYCHPLNIEEEKSELIVGHVSLVTDMLLSSDEKYVVTSDRDEHIRVSRYPNGYNIESFCLGHTDVITKISFLPWKESLLISAGGDGSIRVWDYLKGKQVQVVDIKEKIEPYKPVASDANSEDAIVSALAVDKKNKLLAIGFGKSPALLVFKWTQDEFVYKETIVTSLPILSIAFDLSGQLWVSSAPNKDDDDLISVYRLDQNFSVVESSDPLVNQINQSEINKVNILPDIYSIFGLRKFLDLPEEENSRKKTKTE